MAGVLTAKTLDTALDVNGTSFRQAAAAVGYDSESTQVSSLHSLISDRPLSSKTECCTSCRLGCRLTVR